MVRSQTERLAEKTVERQFLHELEVDFELAPADFRLPHEELVCSTRAGRAVISKTLS